MLLYVAETWYGTPYLCYVAAVVVAIIKVGYRWATSWLLQEFGSQ
jgi:hypothetical protein